MKWKSTLAEYGMVRTTMYADIVADIGSVQVSQLVELLKEEFYIDPEMSKGSIETSANCQV